MGSAFSITSSLRLPVVATSALAASASGLLYWKQNELIYPRNVPAGARDKVPKPYKTQYWELDDWEDLTLDTPDGEKLHAYLLRPPYYGNELSATILMFHGNAGNIGHRLPIAAALQHRVRADILMVEYRGYGHSTGTPDEKGIGIDAQTALDYVRNTEGLKNTNILVYGQSLGGSAAIQLVAKNQRQGDIKALILENTFLSMRKVIPHIMPAAKFLAPLCHQLWPSEEIIPKVNVPTLFLSGAKDEIVPPEHMKTLYNISTAEVKRFKLFEKGTHNNTVGESGYFNEIRDFLDEHVFGKL